MKFRGFLKKGNIKRRSNEISISDPGSDDSWDVLCKDDNQASTVPPGSKPTVALHTAVSAPTSSSVAESAPVDKDASPRNEIIADLSMKQIKSANVSVESQTNTNTKNVKLLPFTSTPFVRHKQVPVLELSSIISPVNESTNERLPGEEPQNDSGTVLVLNRKNSADPADDTFNQLLNPGKRKKRRSFREPGVKPLKLLINQGDTTRQYGGGAVKGRLVTSAKSPCNSTEGSWETTEATATCTAELKKTSNSPDKTPIRSDKPSIPPQTGSKDKAIAKSNHPNDRMNLQDENRVQSTALEGNPHCYIPRKSLKRNPSVFTEMSDGQTKGKEWELDPTLNKKRESHKDGVTTLKKQRESGSNISQGEGTDDRVTSQLEGNHQQGKTAGNKVQGPVGDPPTPINIQTADQTPTQIDKTLPNKTTRKSIISDHTKEKGQGLKKRVSFCKTSKQTDNPQENSAMCIKSKSNCDKELEDRSLEPEVQFLKEKNKRREAGKSESKEEDKNTRRDERISNPQDLSVHPFVDQDEFHSSNKVNKNIKKHQTQNPQNGSVIPDKNMICQSAFAVKIGNTVLTQSNCFGVTVDFHKKKSNENDKLKHTPATACIAVEETQKAKSKANISELGNRHESSNNAEDHAVKESREPLSSTHETLSIQQNKPNEIESSSEEERILLRAQSLKLRENQNNSRNSKSLKIVDSSQLGLNSRHNNSPFKSPVKSLACENRPAFYTSPIGVKESLFSASQGAKDKQPSNSDTLNKSDSHNESESSCNIFISRDPNDFQSNFEEDDFQLEIMSSSEEEKVTSKKLSLKHSSAGKLESNVIHKPQNEEELSKRKHLRKGSRLSLKTKEIRRRRKEKIEENRRSLGNSSGSDSPSPRPLQKRTIRRGTKTPSSSAREVEDIEKCKKKLLMDYVGDNSADLGESNAELVVETLPVVPSIEETSNQNSKSKAKQKISRKERTQGIIKPKKIKSLKGKSEILSQDVLHVQGHGNRRMMIDAQLDNENPIQPEEKDNLNNNENVLIDPPTHDKQTSGLRCSHRSRKPPSMYWLGNRGCNDVINACDAEKESTSQSHKKLPYNERKPSNLKSQKRKIDKTSKLDIAKTKRVKQIEQNSATPQIDTSPEHLDEERVLVYDTNNVKENKVKCVTCMPLEVKTTEFVWGCGVKGDLLTLGTEAECADQKASTYNQVFYVLEGKINYQCSQDEKILTTGSVFIVPRGEKYSIRNLGDCTGKLFVTSCSV